jgi:hypothetical protein
MTKFADDWLSRPLILYPRPNQRFAVIHPGAGAGCGKAARPVLCGGALSNGRPFRDP